MSVLEKSLRRIGDVSVELVANECNNEDDALAVATALILAAEKIYLALGGKRHAAAQFYAIADRNTG